MEAGSGVAAPDECDCKGTRKLPKEMLASTSPMDPEDADMLDGLPDDAYRLSMLEYRCAERIGEYFCRNGKLCGIPGHFLQRNKYVG